MSPHKLEIAEIIVQIIDILRIEISHEYWYNINVQYILGFFKVSYNLKI